MKPKIMILDGEQKSALAATRALGKKGYAVAVGSVFPSSLAGSSKYCSETFIYESPFENASGFIETLTRTAARINADILLPMTDITVFTVLKHEGAFDSVCELPLCSFDQYVRASDKYGLVKLAQKCGVAAPATIFVEDREQLDSIKDQIRFPAILKPRASLVYTDGKIHKCGVHFVNTFEELTDSVNNSPGFSRPFMIQEKLTGQGTGVFALYNNGQIVSVFGHRRLREKPPWGGVSVLCESVQPDTLALKYAEALLEALDWHGVAMVEFKRDGKTGEPKLMEINARFWGSLQLSINSGINFPVRLLELDGYSNKTAMTFDHSRLRWLLGDIDNLYLNFKTALRGRSKQSIKKLAGDVYAFISEFFKGSKLEILRVDDFNPFIWECRQYIKQIMGKQ